MFHIYVDVCVYVNTMEYYSAIKKNEEDGAKMAQKGLFWSVLEAPTQNTY